MRWLALLSLAYVISASDVSGDKTVAAATPIGTTTLAPLMTAEEAVAAVAKLPSRDQLHLEEFVISGKEEDVLKVLVRITVSSLYPARPVALAALRNRSPLVLDRALRALTTVGIAGSDQRRQVEGLLMHGDAAVSAQAAMCLGAADDLRACPALIARLRAKAPASASSAAVVALRRLSNVALADEPQQWEEWYQSYRVAADARLAAHVPHLEDADQKKQIQAIQALAGLPSERAEVVEVLAPYAKSRDAIVALAAGQALASLAPRDFAAPSTSELTGAIKPVLPPPPAPPAFVKGLFDTWMGVVLILVVGVCGLTGTVFFLRVPAVRQATQRIRRVVVASTQRLTRPLTTRIRKQTARFQRALTARITKGGTGTKV